MNSNTTENNTVTLRDQFAMAAISGFLATYSGVDTGFPSATDAAETAYEYADAMMNERDKPWSQED